MTEAMYLIAQGGIQISETGTDSTDVPLRNMNCVMWRMLDNCLKPRSVQTRWRLKKFRISPERFLTFDILSNILHCTFSTTVVKYNHRNSKLFTNDIKYKKHMRKWSKDV